MYWGGAILEDLREASSSQRWTALLNLFHVIPLFAHEGPEICLAFVVYLASHNRPVHEA